MQIKLPEKLYIRLEKMATNQGFQDINEYLNFILEEIINLEDSETKELTDKEKEEINEGLKKLGYK